MHTLSHRIYTACIALVLFSQSALPIVSALSSQNIQLLYTKMAGITLFSTCALGSDGQAYCWGANSSGQLGNGTTTSSSTPVAVLAGAIPSGVTLVDISSGGDITCALGSDGQAYCWGNNDYGQLGNGTTRYWDAGTSTWVNNNSSTPVLVSSGMIPSGVTLTTITANPFIGGALPPVYFDTICALGSDEQAYCWGNNDYGQLGNGTTTSSSTPVRVMTPSTTTQILHQYTAGSGGTLTSSGDTQEPEIGADPPIIIFHTGSQITAVPDIGYGFSGWTDGITTPTREDISLSGTNLSVIAEFWRDTTPPVITLSGASSINILSGATYTDAGASWEDNLDGSGSAYTGTLGGTGIFTVSGSVDTSTIGTYTLTYTATDRAGNTSSIVRSVQVTLGQAPVLGFVGSGTIIVPHASTWVDPGVRATDFEDGDIGTGSISASGSVDTNTVGSYTITYTVADSQGNTASIVRTVEVVDTVAPTLSWIGSGEVVYTYGTMWNDPGVTWYDAVDGTGVVMGSGALPTFPGTYTLTYTTTDRAGNISTTLTRTIQVLPMGNTTGAGGGGGSVGGGNIGSAPVVSGGIKESSSVSTPMIVPFQTIQTILNPTTHTLSAAPTVSVSSFPIQSSIVVSSTTLGDKPVYEVQNRVTDYICPNIVQVHTLEKLAVTDAEYFSDDIRMLMMFRAMEQDELTHGQSITTYKDQGTVNNAAEYRPEAEITRAEFVKMLVRSLACRYTHMGTDAGFSDIDSNAWYAEYITFAVKNGWVNGYHDGTFRPDAPITRAEAAKILASAIRLEKSAHPSLPYTDIEMESVFTPYIAALSEKKILTGKYADQFAPSDTLSRGEAARIVYKTFFGGKK